MRRSPSPRFKIIHRDLPPWRSFVFYSYEQASPFGPDEYAREVERAKALSPLPLIASIGCVTDEGWRDYAESVEQAGADAVELNVSCPHGVHLLESRALEEEMVRVVRLVKETVSIPVAVKMTGQLTNPLAVALRLQEAGADGLTVFNRFTGLDIDVEREAPIMHGSYAGHGGPWAIHYVLRWLCEMFPRLRIPLSATGGVVTGEDVAKCILAGATTVQVCTALMLRGPKALRGMVRDFVRWMERKGYRRVDEFRGKASSRILRMEEVDRRPKVVAEVVEGKCSGCGRCGEVCPQGAIEVREGARVWEEICDGCGLCSEVCPLGAIRLVPRV